MVASVEGYQVFYYRLPLPYLATVGSTFVPLFNIAVQAIVQRLFQDTAFPLFNFSNMFNVHSEWMVLRAGRSSGNVILRN